MEGGPYRNFAGFDATPEACQAACRADGQCLAWDYVRPGVYGRDARCFLKNKQPIPFATPAGIAGSARQAAAPPAAAPVAAPATTADPLPNTDLKGSDYRN